MGATYLAMGRFEEAIQQYQTALSIDPAYGKALASLAGLLAVNADARDARAKELHDRGLRLLVLGDIPNAIRSFKSSLEIQNSPDTWLSLAISYERVEKWEEAIGAYNALTITGQNNARYLEAAAKKLRDIHMKRDEVEGS